MLYGAVHRCCVLLNLSLSLLLWVLMLPLRAYGHHRCVLQTESDTVLDDVACMAACTRTSLHVVASEKVPMTVVVRSYCGLA